MNQFVENRLGLKPEHSVELPLLERAYTPPQYGKIQVSRVYPDGSLYYLSLSRAKKQSGSGWNYISRLTDSGLARLKRLISKCCHEHFSVKKPGQDMGIVIWRISCNKSVKEFKEYLSPGDEIEVFSQLEKVLKTNLQQINPG